MKTHFSEVQVKLHFHLSIHNNMYIPAFNEVMIMFFCEMIPRSELFPSQKPEKSG